MSSGTQSAVLAHDDDDVPQGKPPGRLRQSYDKYWYAWAMVLPVVVVLMVLVAYPMLQGIYFSFTNANGSNVARTIGENEIPATFTSVGLQNYIDVFTSADFWSVLGWTVVWTGVCVFMHYLLGLLSALMLNRPMRGRAVYRILLIIPWAVPAFVSTFAWRFIFNTQYGLLNIALDWVGLGPYGWLEEPTLARFSVILVNVWIGFPFMMVALLGGMQAIAPELYEAAEVDGATPWQRFWSVTVPGLRPVSATVILLGTIWTFNMFTIIYLMTGGGPAGSTNILVTFAYNIGFTGTADYALASTYGVIILSILLVYSMVYRRALRAQGEVW